MGEIRGKNQKQIVHTTVGFCKDCGNTWYIGEIPKKRKTWLWVLGWLFIFPLPLTILLLRKKEMKPWLKYGIIAVAWIIYLLIAFSGRASQDKAEENPTLPAVQTTEIHKTDNAENSSALTFMLSWNETGKYGKEMSIKGSSDDEPSTFIGFYVPAGKYDVTNKSASGGAQITVYSGIASTGNSEEFLTEDCDKPIVVMAGGEAKKIEIKEGQFIKLSDDSSDIEFVKK